MSRLALKTDVPNSLWLNLKFEKIFEQNGIEKELATYNPLIPDGSNLKATMLIEFPDEVIRKEKLGQLTGIEHKVWLQVGENVRINLDGQLNFIAEITNNAFEVLNLHKGDEVWAVFKATELITTPT